MQVLIRYAIKTGSWIETGTYLGHTTKTLSQLYPVVHSIEPKRKLFYSAKKKLEHLNNVFLYNGTSEKVLDQALQKIKGHLNVWFDGHFSGGNKYKTFKGYKDCPIASELDILQKHIRRFSKICIFIDDMRDFIQGNEKKGYIDKSRLVTWCISNNLNWRIEHDIFIAKNY